MITASQIISELTAVADAARKANGGEDYVPIPNPEPRYLRVWDQCSYVRHPGTARADAECIVGAWLHYTHGVPLERLAKWEGNDAARVAAALGLKLTFAARIVLNTVQSRQDSGEPWGSAVASTTEVYAGLIESDA